MNVKDKAMEFAIRAHDGKYRKADLEKPYVFHVIDVANLLESYGFDDNVVAAGLLHDVVEDTNYTEEDILREFGRDICSLVMGATEEDRSLSWEERKLGTIKRVKDLDFRHKAIVACDKISNIEDLRFKFGRDGKEDFSAFNRGKDKKLWYWNEVYKSLIFGENQNHPVFVRLKNNLDYISRFFNIVDCEYYPDIDVFNKKLENSSIARKLYYKKLELLKIKNLLKDSGSYVVEFTGGSNEEKSRVINQLKTYFVLSGFKVGVVKDFSKSDHYLKSFYYDFFNHRKGNGKNIIPSCFFKDLNDILVNDYDIVLVDNSLFDKLIKVDMLFRAGIIKKRDYQRCVKCYLEMIREKINMVVAFKNFTIDNIEYNNSLNKCLKLYDNEEVNIYNGGDVFDISCYKLLDICNCIIDDFKFESLDNAKKKIKARNVS